jgi:hypothetical protein
VKSPGNSNSGELSTMKSVTKVALGLVALLLLVSVSGVAAPVPPREHPAYLHALTDLRHARAHLEHPDGSPIGPEESIAVREIDVAIAEIKKAAIDDGKNLNDHPMVDSHLDWPGRLHRAAELLKKAHSDVAQEEDNAFAQGLQQRALEHIDKAHHHVEEAIHGLH